MELAFKKSGLNLHNEIWYHSFQLSRFFDVCLVKYMIHLDGELTNFKGWLGKISRNIMSKFSWSHPFCRFCLFSSTFMSGDQLPRVGQGICGFGAAAVSRHCAPMRSFFEEVENLLGDFALYFGT